MNKTTRSAFCILHFAFCISIAALPAAFSVSGAAGAQLDALGTSIQYPRPEGMSDADYRACLAAKFSLFTWDGSNESAQAVLSRIFPGSTLCDNCDGTVTVHPASALQAGQGLYPVPAGVMPLVTDG